MDPQLRGMAGRPGTVRVFILLSQQPQQEIVRQAEEQRLAERNADRRSMSRALHDPVAMPWDARNAAADLQRVVVETRRAASERIRQAIGPQQERVTLLLRTLGAKSIRAHTAVNVITAEVPAAVLDKLAASADVQEVFPRMLLRPSLYVSVPAIRAPSLWSAYSKGTGEAVGVLDSGVYAAHQDFVGLKIVSEVFLTNAQQDTENGHSCFADDTTPNDNLGHGTHVSGIVASQGTHVCYTDEASNHYYCQGTAPGLSTFYNLKIGWVVSGACGGGGAADNNDVLDAIDWGVTESPIGVFNFSYGAPATGDDDGFSQIVDAIEDTWGVTVAIAAGNDGDNGVETPGISYNGVTAASMDDQGTVDRSDDAISGFSSRGPTEGGRYKPDISAPGNHTESPFVGILSTSSSGGYVNMAGTSMATPHVAGSLALIRSAGAQDGLSAKAILLNSAYNAKTGWQVDSGWGFVDLGQASSEMNDYFRDSLAPAGFELFEGTVNGTLQATMVWNRHVTSACTLSSCPASNLGLYAYDAGNGNLLNSSTAANQNVQQIQQGAVGTAVLAVSPVNLASGVALEPYALAVSAPGFAPRNGPALSVSCTGPAGAVGTNAMFNVVCTATNSGDLTAFSVSGTVEWQGSLPGTSEPLGNAGPGQQTLQQTWQITAPGTPGGYTVEADVNSASYGQTFTGVVMLPVAVGTAYTLTTQALPGGSGVVSASPLPAGGVYAGGTKVCLTATPKPGASFVSWGGTPLDGSNCLTMNGNASVTASFNPSDGGAGNNRSFISATGNDANACSVTAACQSLTRALAVTNPGGEIVVTSAGSYSPATIAQPVTISATNLAASINAASGNALTINTTGNVTISGLSLFGQGTGSDGVQAQQVGILRLYNMRAQGFANAGVEFDGTGQLSLYNSRLTDNRYGLALLNAAAETFVHNSVFDDNSVAGVYAPAGASIVEGSAAHFNGTGYENSGGTLVVSGSRAVLNGTGLAAAGVTATLQFASCSAAMNSVAAYGLSLGAPGSATNEGTNFVIGTTSGTLTRPANLQ